MERKKDKLNIEVMHGRPEGHVEFRIERQSQRRLDSRSVTRILVVRRLPLWQAPNWHFAQSYYDIVTIVKIVVMI